ncbi:DUF2268 domain-containing protein [Halalkalibacter akibai]|uniref:DUF2268 domain-containing protein n=1 Tax=Halalkalibacter akibai (strain ATCC 43226 / DSM 21942 / CIP 109018 / JCM 9157 / 1139) TaxID=1236973 RepID=W4QU80_HALA3|nr:DUF2268 domain-containing putative Zn-dependent protease [Halalkalibacter akibai]GAE35447.1 hypothetical protein JCM9157_2551 [Halalkalibacter akibai JCM 9157]
MGVVRTDKWLEAYTVKWNQAMTLQEKIECQRDVIIQPLSEVFKTKDVIGLHQYLMQMGLFHPEQSIDLEYEQWKESVPWFIIQKQFNKLKEKWNGPDVKIYVLPLTDQNQFLETQLGSKTGLTIDKAILLFIRASTSVTDLQALITHEYHHVCRLASTKQSEQSMELLESMVMEGLAEFAVKEEIGVEACASWTNRYDKYWKDHWYTRWIKPNLNLKGRVNHIPFLYGDEANGIPLWLGYYTGFQIVKTSVSLKESATELMSISARDIYGQSKFK